MLYNDDSFMILYGIIFLFLRLAFFHIKHQTATALKDSRGRTFLLDHFLFVFILTNVVVGDALFVLRAEDDAIFNEANDNCFVLA